jgi:hypothetical protein
MLTQAAADTELQVARLVRRNQLRACFTCSHAVCVVLVTISIFLVVNSISLKSNHGCTIMARGQVRHLDPGDPQCNKMFAPLIITACALALVVLVLSTHIKRQRETVLRGDASVGAYPRTWRLCALLRFNSIYWCCGEHAEPADLQKYDARVQGDQQPLATAGP